MLYFAHGSNLDRPQMQVRCPAARFVAIARLPDYRVCFPRWSELRASAVASIEPAQGRAVWGALYEIDEAGLVRLDAAEGCFPQRNTSRRQAVKIERPDGGLQDASTHIANPAPDPRLPSAGYMLVLVRAAASLGLPSEFVAELRAIQPQPLAA